MRSLLGAALGAIAFAATILILSAAPGVLSDRDSTVPACPVLREVGK